MSAEIQRAQDSFVVIDGDNNTRRGIVIGRGDKILTALHNLRGNQVFEIFLPENSPSPGAKIAANSLKFSTSKALDTAIIHLPRPITSTWANIAGRKSLNPFASRYLITDVSGAIESQKITVNKDTTSNLQDIFDRSRMPLNARNFEVLKVNALLNRSYSGSIIANDLGEVQAIVSGVIDDHDKSLLRRTSGLLGGKSNDVFATRQNALISFINENIHS